MDNILYPAPKQEYNVLVRCFTFNHSKYIEDALNGFAMQQTNFPFVCLVIDDASTDGEQVVIKKWMERECDMDKAETIDIPTSIVIIVPHKSNPSCTFAFYLLRQNLFKDIVEKMRHVDPWREKCEYEAICEGDDYWIDSLKLQKQVDFLEKNIDVSMVFSNCHVLKGNTYVDDKYFAFKGILNKYYSSDELYENWIVPTASILHRINCYKTYSDERIYAGDIVRVLSLAEAGNIYGMLDYMTVYRLNDNGLTITRESNLSETTFIRDINHTQFLKETFKNVSLKLYNRKLSISYADWFLYKLKNHGEDKLNCLYLSLKYDFMYASKFYIKKILKSYVLPKRILEIIRRYK